MNYKTLSIVAGMLGMVWSEAFAGADYERFDVNGIKLNMPFATVKTTLKKSNPQLIIQEREIGLGQVVGSRVTGGTPFPWALYVRTPYGKGLQDHYVITGHEIPNAGKVSAIYRELALGDNRVLLSALSQKIFAKYGEPLLEFKPDRMSIFGSNNGMHVMSWSTDIKGKPIKDPDALNLCRPPSVESIAKISSHGKQGRDECGLFFAFNLRGQNDTVSGVQSFLMDYPLIIRRNDETVELTKKLTEEIDRRERQKVRNNALPDL